MNKKMFSSFLFLAIFITTFVVFSSEVSAFGQAMVTAQADIQTASSERDNSPGASLNPTPTIPPTVSPGFPDTPAGGTERISDTDQMPLVYIPEGKFIMGTADRDAKLTVENGRAYPEIPMHIINLDSFWMDKYEVTNQRYEMCVNAGGCNPPHYPSSLSRLEYYGNPEYADYPVVYVDWYMARDYCTWGGRRLATEAEWEKAARGTDGRRYVWGNEPISGERANFCDKNCIRPYANPNYDDGYPETAPVGSFPEGASFYGLMDMAGNVWEWTSTIPEPYPYDPDDGRENMEGNSERVWRGGPWSNGVWWIRASIRYRSVPEYKYYNLGFRCAVSDNP